MNIVILGPQGSGKGTQARKLVDTYGFKYLEMGSYLRKVAKTDHEVDQAVNIKGILLPDKKVFSLVKDYLNNIGDVENILFDGYPRSEEQYTLLKGWLENQGSKIDRVIWLDIPDGEVVRRLSGRRVCEKCGKVWNLETSPKPPEINKCTCGGNLIQREDDKPTAIKKRLEEFKAKTQPLVKIFEKEGILNVVNGQRPIEAIFQELATIAK